MTERNLADAFHKARNQGAILLLDEVDSLLRSRASAQHSWEATQVNELLVQMEAFRGILIACTNYREILDGAAARRFDMKIQFGYLEPGKAWEFFQAILKQHGARFRKGKKGIGERIQRLHTLTPGDFKTALRKLTVNGQGVSAQSLLESLEGENSAKGMTQERGIGFLAEL